MSTTLTKIKTKVTHIDIDELMTRLKLELRLNTDTETNTESSVDVDTLLEYALYDTLLIILDITHLKKVDESLYSIWVNMIKDYWSLNGYDKLIDGSEEDDDDSDIMASSIKTGDTQVNFSEKASSTTINGTKYSTGTVNPTDDIIREKYKYSLYGHRILRW